jgi:hypothetical protein
MGIRCGQWAVGDGFADTEHVLVYTGLMSDSVVEAEPGGARERGIEEYADQRILWLPAPTDQISRETARQALALVRTPYSFLDYDALAMHRWRIPAPGLKHFIQDTGHMICSQLADEAARRSGWKWFDDDRWPGYVSPGATRRMALSTGTAVWTGPGAP